MRMFMIQQMLYACLHKLLGIKWYHHVWNDDVRWKTDQPHLSATFQARRLSLFGHTVRMPDESNAKRILTAAPLENWRRPLGRPSTMWMKTTQHRTWNQWTSPRMKQLMGSESSTLEIDVYVWHYALTVVHARNERMIGMLYLNCHLWRAVAWNCRSHPMLRLNCVYTGCVFFRSVLFINSICFLYL